MNSAVSDCHVSSVEGRVGEPSAWVARRTHWELPVDRHPALARTGILPRSAARRPTLLRASLRDYGVANCAPKGSASTHEQRVEVGFLRDFLRGRRLNFS